MIHPQHCARCGAAAGTVSRSAVIGHPCPKSKRKDGWEWFDLDEVETAPEVDPGQLTIDEVQ